MVLFLKYYDKRGSKIQSKDGKGMQKLFGGSEGKRPSGRPKYYTNKS
jgi:hypothetical protein